MRLLIRSVILTTAAFALAAWPAAAQHRGGGHGDGGHSAGGRAPGAIHGSTNASGSHRSTGHPVVGGAVPRGSVSVPRVDQHTTILLPSRRSHLDLGTFGVGLGVGAYAYPRGYGYSPYPYSSPLYYGSSSGYYGGYARNSHARLRILGAPRGAEVYVDGYYAGLVDDFDGVFQHLEQEPGPHRIEIRAPGFPPDVFDMQAVDGRAVTYRAQMGLYRP